MIEHSVKADLVISVPMTFESGSGVTSLTGATVVAQASDGFSTITGTATVAPDGLSVNVSFAENTFKRGTYELSVWATLGSTTQKIASEQIIVGA